MEASQISIGTDKTTVNLGESVEISGVVESANCTLGYCIDINYNPVTIVISNTSTGEYYNFIVNSALVPFASYNYKYIFTPTKVGNYDVFADFSGNANFDASDSITAHFSVASAQPPATCLKEGEYDYAAVGLDCCPGLHRDGYLSGYCVKDVAQADVHLWRVAGAGSVEAFKNGVSIGTMAASEGSKTFTFNIGDTFKFVAHPASGWAFDKYCADSACATKSNSSTFTGKIVNATVNMYVYFSQGGAGCVPVTRHCETPLNGYDTDGCTRGANAACNPVQPQPGTGKRYSCINGVCTDDPNGVYTTSACGGACAPAPQTEPPYTEIAIAVAGIIAAALILKKKE